jgi:HD superfamily phosphohydrolase YqeK
VASTDPVGEAVATSALVLRAARGELPDWSRVSAPRLAHMGRVATLLGEWAGVLALPETERVRWLAVGWLHDVLREEDPANLRGELPDFFRDLPPPVLHGPAAAERLRGELDEAALEAIRYHTIGHPSLDRLGRALYLADFLEPGRDFLVEWRAELRAHMPHEMDAVLVEVLASRLRHLVEGRRPIRPETAAFWSAVVEAGR